MPWEVRFWHWCSDEGWNSIMCTDEEAANSVVDAFRRAGKENEIDYCLPVSGVNKEKAVELAEHMIKQAWGSGVFGNASKT